MQHYCCPEASLLTEDNGVVWLQAPYAIITAGSAQCQGAGRGFQFAIMCDKLLMHAANGKGYPQRGEERKCGNVAHE